MYNYLFDYEISINAFYIPHKKHLGAASQKYLESKRRVTVAYCQYGRE